MEETRNLLMAIALSICAIMLWYVFVQAPAQQEALKWAEENGELLSNTVEDDGPIGLTAPVEEDSPEILPEREELIEQSIQKKHRLPIKSGNLEGSLYLVGGRIDDLVLTKYLQELSKNSDEVVLLSPHGTQEMYFAEFGWLPAKKGTVVPNAKTVWSSSHHSLEENIPITISWNNGHSVDFKRIISLDENYLFTIKQEVENNTNETIKLYPYGFIHRGMELPDNNQMFWHEGPLGVFNEILEEYSYVGLTDNDQIKKEGSIEYKDVNGWVGIADKYWLTALIPPTASVFDAHIKYNFKQGLNRYEVDYIGEPLSIAAGSSASVTQYFFAGAKELDVLDHYVETIPVSLFDKAIDFGWLYFLTRPLFEALQLFSKILGDFGSAILMLTVVVRLLLFPLANKSYKSMSRMRLVHPELMELRDRYKDDKMKLNQEMMKFYKERNINPMSGCLPILIQIPIFFALYRVLLVDIEMRHASFYGLIDDLSAPDPTNMINVFGLLPFEPPGYLPAIGLLLLIWGGTMYIQYRLNPQPTDETQAMIIKWMPVMFIIMMAIFKMPAGLIIYWIWSNILAILQQWVISRKLNAEPSG